MTAQQKINSYGGGSWCSEKNTNTIQLKQCNICILHCFLVLEYAKMRGYIYIWNRNPLLKNDHSSSIHTTLKILNPHLQKSLLPLSPNQQPLIGKSFDGKFDEFPNKNLSNFTFTTISKTTHFHPIFTPSNLPNHKIPNKNYPLTNPHYFYQKQLISHFKI